MGYWGIGVCGTLGGRAQGIPVLSSPRSAGVISTPKKAATLPSRSGLSFAFHLVSVYPLLKLLPGRLPGLIPLNSDPFFHSLIHKLFIEQILWLLVLEFGTCPVELMFWWRKHHNLTKNKK